MKPGSDGHRRETGWLCCRNRAGYGNRAAGGQWDGERWVARSVPDDRRAWLVYRPPVGGSHHGPAVRRWRPRHAEARLEVQIVLLIDLLDVDADAHQRRGGFIEHHELVVPFGRGHVPFVAQPEIDRQVGTESDLVLSEGGYGVLRNVATALTQSDAECVGRPGHERRDARKVEKPGALSEVVVEEATELAAETERVLSRHVREGVVDDVKPIVPALRINGRPTKIEPAGDDHLRQAERAVDSRSDPEIRRVERICRDCRAVLTAPAESGFVEEPRSKYVRFVGGQDALHDLPRLTESRNGRSLRAWFETLHVLPADVASGSGHGRRDSAGDPRSMCFHRLTRQRNRRIVAFRQRRRRLPLESARGADGRPGPLFGPVVHR